MNDLIDRQAAIDAIENTDWYHQNANGDMVSGASNEHEAWYRAEDVYKALESVPSAQPETHDKRTETHTCDCMNRQEAVVESHNEKQILGGCISLIQEMCDYFREYLDFIDFEPEYEEEKQPFCMSYFHIVNRLFLFHTRHSGGNSTRTKCYELGIDDSSEQVLFTIWEGEDDE